MHVEAVGLPDIGDALSNAVLEDVTGALKAVVTQGEQFIVNPTPWLQASGKKLVSSCVVNSATFITSKFAEALKGRGWATEKNLLDQTIDAYREFPVPTEGFYVPEANFLDFFAAFIRKAESSGQEMDTLFSSLYQRYVKRSIFGTGGIPSSLHRSFMQSGSTGILRVGLEFETGNIASSFRALSKLNFLFTKKSIDAGVFITSLDKANCATLIWPVSNRNGSFEELRNRQYKGSILFPAWEIGFKPDGSSADADYLGKDGSLYKIEATGVIKTIKGIEYEVWRGKRNVDLLKRHLP